jgi:hypothetical protein
MFQTQARFCAEKVRHLSAFDDHHSDIIRLGRPARMLGERYFERIEYFHRAPTSLALDEGIQPFIAEFFAG